MRRAVLCCTLLCGVAIVPALALAGPGDHPQINRYTHRYVFDWDTRDYVYQLTVRTVVDGIDEVRVDFIFEAANPATGPFDVRTRVRGSGTVDPNQVATFGAYVPAIYVCDDSQPAAHAYDNPSTWNPLGDNTIQDFARDIGQLRFQSFACPDLFPPPLGLVCDADAAPHVDELVPDSSSFFYVDIELDNGSIITLGFEYDGDRWEFAEQYGDPGDCDGQLDTFADYTLSILTSPSCAADPVYTPEEEAEIAWYVQEVENFCQDNLPPVCDATAAPHVDELVPDSSSFFYVDIELDNGTIITLGFEHDGDRWEFAEQYGVAAECQGQLDTFANYTMAILTSPGCAAAPAYTPAEEAVIAWYVFEVENFCQDNL